jgi:hypothetical protein
MSGIRSVGRTKSNMKMMNMYIDIKKRETEKHTERYAKRTIRHLKACYLLILSYVWAES